MPCALLMNCMNRPHGGLSTKSELQRSYGPPRNSKNNIDAFFGEAATSMSAVVATPVEET